MWLMVGGAGGRLFESVSDVMTLTRQINQARMATFPLKLGYRVTGQAGNRSEAIIKDYGIRGEDAKSAH